MYEKQISLINEYCKRIFEPKRISTKREFMQSSYSKWAAREILLYVRDNIPEPPSISVERFAKKMDSYSCKNIKTSIIFSVAYDTAMDILDMLLEEKK